MANRTLRICILSFVLALAGALTSVPNPWQFIKYKVGIFDKAGETQAVRDSIKQFSASIAGFYASGGSIQGLNMFPADNTVKRRIFLDIQINRESGFVLVADRDRSDVKQITFSDTNHASAIVNEAWFMQYQNIGTRKPVSDKKANYLTLRYLFKKIGGKWIVMDFDVYGRNDSIPPVQQERLAAW